MASPINPFTSNHKVNYGSQASNGKPSEGLQATRDPFKNVKQMNLTKPGKFKNLQGRVDPNNPPLLGKKIPNIFPPIAASA